MTMTDERLAKLLELADRVEKATGADRELNGRFAGAACEQRQCGVNCEMRAVHFVWFRGDEYARACRVFGKPDFVHMSWDRRSRREVAADDIIIFARGPHDQPYAPRNSSDIIEADFNRALSAAACRAIAGSMTDD